MPFGQVNLWRAWLLKVCSAFGGVKPQHRANNFHSSVGGTQLRWKTTWPILPSLTENQLCIELSTYCWACRCLGSLSGTGQQLFLFPELCGLWLQSTGEAWTARQNGKQLAVTRDDFQNIKDKFVHFYDCNLTVLGIIVTMNKSKLRFTCAQ